MFCFGEVLWDCLPSGLYLGGAPFNVASHLARLGVNVRMVSAVGDDVLGAEALSRMDALGVDTRYVPVLKGRQTGSVGVKLDTLGNASYTIRENVAWDHIPLMQGLPEEMFRASALVFGTLALRSEQNMRCLEALLEVEWPMRVYDVNLREPYYSMEQVLTLARLADLVKCNEEEARLICSAPASVNQETLLRMLADITNAGRVCITLGPRGALYMGPTGILHAVAPKVRTVDSVGAGDAFLAAIVAAIVQGKENHPDFLLRACRLGAYVATCEGAVPPYRAASFALEV